MLKLKCFSVGNLGAFKRFMNGNAYWMVVEWSHFQVHGFSMSPLQWFIMAIEGRNNVKTVYSIECLTSMSGNFNHKISVFVDFGPLRKFIYLPHKSQWENKNWWSQLTTSHPYLMYAETHEIMNKRSCFTKPETRIRICHQNGQPAMICHGHSGTAELYPWSDPSSIVHCLDPHPPPSLVFFVGCIIQSWARWDWSYTCNTLY